MEYACKGCGVKYVKLWRDYGTPSHWDLWCVDCACDKSDDISASSVRADGTRPAERGYDTTELGWYVPAIQCQADPEVFWGYSSWTEERRGDWDYWTALPLRNAA